MFSHVSCARFVSKQSHCCEPYRPQLLRTSALLISCDQTVSSLGLLVIAKPASVGAFRLPLISVLIVVAGSVLTVVADSVLTVAAERLRVVCCMFCDCELNRSTVGLGSTALRFSLFCLVVRWSCARIQPRNRLSVTEPQTDDGRGREVRSAQWS